MAANQIYYVGTGKKLNRKTAKKYKTLQGACAAALKLGATVWDSAGVMVAEPDASKPQEPAAEPTEPATETATEPTEPAAEPATETATEPTEPAESEPEEGTGENTEPAETAADEAENDQNKPVKRVATVIVVGSLRLRRSAGWDAGNVCGYASAGQKYHVKRTFEADGRPMLETIDGLFISADPAHVRIE